MGGERPNPGVTNRAVVDVQIVDRPWPDERAPLARRRRDPSYGTVQEPCSFTTKFPEPAVVIARYPRGETLLEAYRKSVAMPGQAVFVGEPLAAPFRAR